MVTKYQKMVAQQISNHLNLPLEAEQIKYDYGIHLLLRNTKTGLYFGGVVVLKEPTTLFFDGWKLLQRDKVRAPIWVMNEKLWFMKKEIQMMKWEDQKTTEWIEPTTTTKKNINTENCFPKIWVKKWEGAGKVRFYINGEIEKLFVTPPPTKPKLFVENKKIKCYPNYTLKKETIKHIYDLTAEKV